MSQRYRMSISQLVWYTYGIKLQPMICVFHFASVPSKQIVDLWRLKSFFKSNLNNLKSNLKSNCDLLNWNLYTGWHRKNWLFTFVVQVQYFYNETRNYDNVHVAPRTLVKAVLNLSSTGWNSEWQSFAKLSYSTIDNVLTNLLPKHH